MTEPTETQPPSDDIRYARQMRFPAIGRPGQQALGGSRVAIVGAGALGSVTAQQLVRSGVGFVRVIDRDIVEWSNLQRQMLYSEQDALGFLPKAEAAAARLRTMNSSVEIEPVVQDLTVRNAESLLADTDLIVDGTDNFSVRYLLNDISVKHGIPWIYGGAVGASGMTMTVLPGVTPCYRCLFPEPPMAGTTDTCETAGILSPIVDIVGSLQAMEAIKLLAGKTDALHGKLIQIDLWNNRSMPMNISGARRSECPACGRRTFEFLDAAAPENAAASLCGRHTVQITPARPASLNLRDLAARLQAAGEAELSPFALRLKLTDEVTFVLFPDGRALVQGTDSNVKARAIYAEIMGI